MLSFGVNEGMKRRLSAITFSAVTELLPAMSAERLEMARKVLVDGQTMPSVGDEYGCSRQAVNTAVNQVWIMAERFNRARFICLAEDKP
jgi:hypothetical protein